MADYELGIFIPFSIDSYMLQKWKKAYLVKLHNFFTLIHQLYIPVIFFKLQTEDQTLAKD